MIRLKQLRHSLVFVLVLSPLAGAVGCAQQATSFDTGVQAEQTTLSVRNDHWQDVRVYLITAVGSETVRLGTVSAASSARIPITGRMLQEIRNRGSVRLQLRPLGSRSSYTTDAVLVQPGDEMLLSVTNHLALTTFYVRRSAG